MAQSGGGDGDGAIAGKSGKVSCSSFDAAGEDRLSALPDDVLVLILLGLNTTAEAARTSVLSRRWRGVWPLLPELRFRFVPEGHRIREVLRAPDAAPPLRLISVVAEDSGPESSESWLPEAARRLSGDLVYYNALQAMEAEKEEDGAGDPGAVQLPCFENVTGMHLTLGFLGLALPLAGTFARLVKLILYRVRLHGPCELSDVVSSQRCPSLQKLIVAEARGVDKLTINSESLLQVDLRYLKELSQLTIVASALEKLILSMCFLWNQPVADITAPQLVLLEWRDSYDPSSVQLGNLGRLQQLNTGSFLVYWEYDCVQNKSIMRLLQQFQFIHILNITLVYLQNIGNLRYSSEDITMLPQTTLLKMEVRNEGHDFGPSSFHMLRLCTGIRRLALVLCTSRDLEPACPPGCHCDQPTDWKTEELSLNRLEEVEISDLKGSDHEVVFVERLCSWATVLKKMRMTFDYSVSKSKAREVLQTLASFSKPETLVESYMYRNANKTSTYLLALED